MAAMGFSEKLVTQTVNELLKVYGDGGWVFIEEASYLLLINILLKKQNDDYEEKDTSLGDGDRGREDTETSAVGPPTTIESLDSVSLTNDSAEKDCLPTAEAEKRGLENMDLNSGKRSVNFIAGRIVKDIGACKYNMKILGGSQQLVGGVSSGTRKPCHGWLCDDDEDDDLEDLPPDPLPDCLEKPLVGWNGNRKRNRRWDMRPEDM
nr:uncharacterized protein LOC107413783 isoform X3 [Ziziphus jujuba var. spinosa]